MIRAYATFLISLDVRLLPVTWFEDSSRRRECSEKAIPRFHQMLSSRMLHDASLMRSLNRNSRAASREISRTAARHGFVKKKKKKRRNARNINPPRGRALLTIRSITFSEMPLRVFPVVRNIRKAAMKNDPSDRRTIDDAR